MSDIVERIRNRINDAPMPTEHLLDEAADTLTALRTEVAQLRELLDIAVEDHDSSMGRSNVPAHWSNRARAALTQTKDTTDDA